MAVDDVTVVIPFASCADPHREAACRFVVEWLRPHGWPIVVHELDPSEPWSKGAVVDAAVQQIDTPGLIVHDADVIVEPDALAACATAIVSGYPWAQPHSDVYRLSRRATQMLLSGTIVGPHHHLGGAALERRPHVAPPGGGIVVVQRSAYDTVGGIDPRFIGWGGEDISFARALDTLVGPAYRLRHALWHLYHAPQMIRPGRRGSDESERLASLYLDADGSVEQMRKIRDERCGSRTDRGH